MRLLLDVNVLVAIFDEAHVHHARANTLIEKAKLKIATCAMTENGVIRVMNLPGYGEFGPAGFDAVREKLVLLCNDKDHEYFASAISFRSPSLIDWSRISGHNQITDVYLLALAVTNNAALASFDQRVAFSAVRGAEKRHLVLL